MFNDTDTKLKNDHYAHMSNIAKNLLANDLNTLVVVSEGTYEYIANRYYPPALIKEIINNAELIVILRKSLDYTSQLYNKLGLFDSFRQHFQSEYPEIKDLKLFLESTPLEYVNALKSFSSRKEFRSTCYICDGW